MCTQNSQEQEKLSSLFNEKSIANDVNPNKAN